MIDACRLHGWPPPPPPFPSWLTSRQPHAPVPCTFPATPATQHSAMGLATKGSRLSRRGDGSRPVIARAQPRWSAHWARPRRDRASSRDWGRRWTNKFFRDSPGRKPKSHEACRRPVLEEAPAWGGVVERARRSTLRQARRWAQTVDSGRGAGQRCHIGLATAEAGRAGTD
jgi:hypothetical protein